MARDTEWIRERQRKKRKASKSLSPTAPENPRKANETVEKQNKEKSTILNPPPIIITDAKDYQNLYKKIKTEFNQDFSIVLLNNGSIKINPKTGDVHRGIT